jgi:predicted small secreted protein
MSKKVKAALVTAVLTAATLAASSGCETVKGAGKDLQNASQATEDAIKGK